MPTWRNREELIQQAVELRSRGMKNHAIARVLGVSRNTVKKVLSGHHAALSTGVPPSVTGIIANEWWDARRRNRSRRSA